MMSRARLSSRGRITIPTAVRNGLGVKTGDQIEFIAVAPGHYELVAATLPVTTLKGLVALPKKPVSLDEMNAAVRRQATQALKS